MAGATVVFARPGGHQDIAYLADMIAEEGITAVLLVPSVLRLLLREWEDRPPAPAAVCGTSVRMARRSPVSFRNA